MKTIPNSLKHVVFLDRDGVINHDSPNYIKKWDEFHFIDYSIDAIARLTKANFTCIIITNQSAVNRRIITLETLRDIHGRMIQAIKDKGGNIRDIFFCPHTPDEACNCRKPKTGLIDQAKQKYNIDMNTAFMVGDNAKDIECGINAGCRYTLMVKTGNDVDAEKKLLEKKIAPDFIAQNLAEAAQRIIKLLPLQKER